MIIQNENKTKRTWKEAPREKISPDDCIISRQNKKVVCTTVKSPLYRAEDKKLNSPYKFINIPNEDKKKKAKLQTSPTNIKGLLAIVMLRGNGNLVCLASGQI